MDNDSGRHWRSRVGVMPTGSETTHEEAAATLAVPLRAPEHADPTLADRVMTAVRAEAALGRRNGSPRDHASPWWRRSIAVRITPVGSLALAAGLAAIMLTGAHFLPRGEHAGAARVAVASRPDTVHVVRFVFVAPGASSVTVAGDFNGWDATSHRLRPTGAEGVWSTSIPLASGRHEYAFVIDGTTWVVDPDAPRALADEFGAESSVIRVGRVDGPRSG